MTDNIRIVSDLARWYKSPLVKVIEIKTRGILCGSLDPSTETDPEEDILP